MRPESSELPPTRHQVVGDDGTQWCVQLRWQIVDGLPECVGMSLDADSPQSRLTDAVIRRIPWSRLAATDRAKLLLPPPAGAGLRASERVRYERVAEVYRKALAERRPPVRAVAEAEHLSQGGASALVARVRRAGFLPPTSAGVALGDVESSTSGDGIGP